MQQNMNTHFQALMGHLDDLQDSIPEGKYVDFCNALRDAKRHSDRSLMYKILYVDVTIHMNTATVSVVTPRTVSQVIDPYEFFVNVSPDYIPDKISKLQETISNQGFARTPHGGAMPHGDYTAVSVYWDDDGDVDPIHVRLDRNRDIIIISLEPVEACRPRPSKLTMHAGLLKRIFAHVQEGLWHMTTGPDNVPSFVDNNGRPQVTQKADGTLVQIMYSSDTEVNPLTLQ